MTPAKLIVVAAFGLSAAACSYSSTTTATVPPGPYRSGAEQACVDYGFQPGTDSYNRCVTREAQSRAAGRMPADYASARLAGSSRSSQPLKRMVKRPSRSTSRARPSRSRARG